MTTDLSHRPHAPAPAPDRAHDPAPDRASDPGPDRAADVTPALLGPDELGELVRSIAARSAEWRPLPRFTEGQRGGARLAAPAGVDVWVLSWLRSQGTEPHDHGDSSAAFTVVAGTLTELRPDAAGTLVPQALGTGHTQTVAPGQIHDVVNRDRGPAVSIHAYSPPLTRMTYYAPTPEGLTPTRTVDTT